MSRFKRLFNAFRASYTHQDSECFKDVQGNILSVGDIVFVRFEISIAFFDVVFLYDCVFIDIINEKHLTTKNST